MPDLPFAAYPGHINLHTLEALQRNVRDLLVDQIIANLTIQPSETRPRPEPGTRDTVFEGTFDEVNSFFYDKGWSEGLPVAPPTEERVARFMKFTDRAADEVIGVLLPDRREATPWNIAVNGVMAGCRPQYMPVLIAIVEALVDPKFAHSHLGNTPGTEALITVNGPIIQELGFNYEQGALRVGFQANTSIGRFFRLYLRNVAGYLPHKTDKATFGGTWRVVLAENEDALARIGWEPMSVDQGFKAGDNVITISSCTSTDSLFSTGETIEGTNKAEAILRKLAARIVDVQLVLFHTNFLGPSVRPQILLSPCVAEAIAGSGFSKARAKQYLWEHARFAVERYEAFRPVHDSLCQGVRDGKLPPLYCESADPKRLVPIVFSPDDFMITVSGDPGRDNCFICGQNGYIGYPVSKKIQTPAKWEQLL
ncbi:MAG: hypothetical protein HYY32_04105 [Chloroflexi bacterium]|nr:hypothetical protein [Chloroflexota bacterium]